MTTRELIDAALRRGLIRTTSKTPEKTMKAQLYTQAKKAGAPIVRVSESSAQRAPRGSLWWALGTW